MLRHGNFLGDRVAIGTGLKQFLNDFLIESGLGSGFQKHSVITDIPAILKIHPEQNLDHLVLNVRAL